jgi:hypothetical protein
VGWAGLVDTRPGFTVGAALQAGFAAAPLDRDRRPLRARKDGPKCLIAPFERNPEKRLEMKWIDRTNPRRGATSIRVDASREIKDCSVAVLSLGDYFDEYRPHPEIKALGPDGKPCHTWRRGLLWPRHLRVAEPLTRIGKESNRLAETPLPPDLDDKAMDTSLPSRLRSQRAIVHSLTF